jgi:predicted nuclease of restriction endonuclease-like (RecB) superfamily
MANTINKEPSDILLTDLQRLIDSARQSVAVSVNSTMTLLYWQIGKRIGTEVLNEKRAEYGKQIIKELAQHLTLNYGKGWSARQLAYCVKVAEVFPTQEILHTVCAKLSWSHLRFLVSIEDPLKRNFYIEISKLENWSVRQLQERMNSMLFERTAISKKPEKTMENDLKLLRDEDKLSPELVFRDPYFLDFLGLSDEYLEKDLESAILVELQKFIIEFGQDFAFLARQKRISIDNRDYYIDLLFYHRRLKSLVAIDLKIGEFEAGYKGQMELYLRYLEKYERVEGENSPIGLILCAGKNDEHIELLQLDKSNIRVAEYLTQLPPKEVLQAKLHQSFEIACNKFLAEELDEHK